MSPSLQDLIEATAHYDKDNRYMAVNDIIKYIDDGNDIQGRYESRLFRAILALAQDPTNDVKGIAIKCLPKLIPATSKELGIAIFKEITELLLQAESDSRDIYSIGLINCLKSVSTSSDSIGIMVMDSILPEFIKSVSLPLQDVIVILIEKFQTELQRKEEYFQVLNNFLLSAIEVENMLLPQTSIQMKSLISHVAMMANNLKNTNTLRDLIRKIKVLCKKESIMSQALALEYLACVCSEHTKTVISQNIQTFISLIHVNLDLSNKNGLKFTLRCENSLLVLKNLILYCWKDIEEEPMFESVYTTVLNLLKYDPNYIYTEQDKTLPDFTKQCPQKRKQEDNKPHDMEVECSSEDEDDFGDFDYDEDIEDINEDDSSWTIRLASLRVIEVLNDAFTKKTDFSNRALTVTIQTLYEVRIEREAAVREKILLLLQGILFKSIFMFDSVKEKSIYLLRVCDWILSENDEKNRYISSRVVVLDILLELIEREYLYRTYDIDNDLNTSLLSFFTHIFDVFSFSFFEEKQASQETLAFCLKLLNCLEKLLYLVKLSNESNQLKLLDKSFLDLQFKLFFLTNNKLKSSSLRIASLIFHAGNVSETYVKSSASLIREILRDATLSDESSLQALWSFVLAVTLHVQNSYKDIFSMCSTAIFDGLRISTTANFAVRSVLLTITAQLVQDTGMDVELKDTQLSAIDSAYADVLVMNGDLLDKGLNLCLQHVTRVHVLSENVLEKLLALAKSSEHLRKSQQALFFRILIKLKNDKGSLILNSFENLSNLMQDEQFLLGAALLTCNLGNKELLLNKLLESSSDQSITIPILNVLSTTEAPSKIPRVFLWKLRVLEETESLLTKEYLVDDFISIVEQEQMDDSYYNLSQIFAILFKYFPKLAINSLNKVRQEYLRALLFSAACNHVNDSSVHRKVLVAYFEKILALMDSLAGDDHFLDRKTYYSGISDTLALAPDILFKRYKYFPNIDKLEQNWSSFINFLIKTLPDVLLKKKFKEQVDFGPFKKTIDNGLPTRKAAFRVFANFFSLAVTDFTERMKDSRLQVNIFLSYVLRGLEDDGDIQFLCHDIVRAMVKNLPTLFWESEYCNNIADILCKVHIKKKKSAVEVANSIKEISDVLVSSLKELKLDQRDLMQKFLTIK